MEMEFKDNAKRRKALILLGVVLALVAGGGAFMIVSQAKAEAPAQVATRTILVAARDIPGKTVIESADLTQRTVADDPSMALAISDPAQVIGRLTGVAILYQQPITANLLASTTAGVGFSILAPNETLAPDSPVWRAVAVDVPDERAVGGQLQVGQHVDVFVTTQVNVVLPEVLAKMMDDGTAQTAAAPAGVSPSPAPGASAAPAASAVPDASLKPFYTDKSTKVTLLDVPILAKNGTMYVLKVDEHAAEEIAHLQASGNSGFSLALRPDGDHRTFDQTEYGETTNKIIEQYGLPVPEIYPLPGQVPSRGQTPIASQAPSGSPAASPTAPPSK